MDNRISNTQAYHLGFIGRDEHGLLKPCSEMMEEILQWSIIEAYDAMDEGDDDFGAL